jgi:hypothetical protein
MNPLQKYLKTSKLTPSFQIGIKDDALSEPSLTKELMQDLAIQREKLLHLGEGDLKERLQKVKRF